ncbi:MAG: ACP S-malonyltransferase [Planctomycetota bacterium]|jgi:acyl transferase domain-containing protein
MSKRIALFCPGRGSYNKKSLRTLKADEPWVRKAEELRAGYGLTPLLELDGAKRFDKSIHLLTENVSPLIYVFTMLDARDAMDGNETVCVGGNSMGWYTALAVAGALSFEDGFRLVQEMAILQAGYKDGGQIVYPITDEEWRPDEKLRGRVDAALADAPGEAFFSIDLGGYVVLAGSEKGVAHLLKALPPVELGPSLFPFRLAGHGPYHTSLLRGVAEKAATQLARLQFKAPDVTLVDGRGARFTPWSTDPAELAAYTLGQQITTPFLFAKSVQVALREYAPDQLALPGPGNSLGGSCGQILVRERWNGVASRTEFEADPGLVWSLRRF